MRARARNAFLVVRIDYFSRRGARTQSVPTGYVLFFALLCKFYFISSQKTSSFLAVTSFVFALFLSSPSSSTAVVYIINTKVTTSSLLFAVSCLENRSKYSRTRANHRSNRPHSSSSFVSPFSVYISVHATAAYAYVFARKSNNFF